MRNRFRQNTTHWRPTAVAILVAILSAGAQGLPLPFAGQTSAASAAPAAENAGGIIRGVVKSGNTALPGVTVTATNTLTGKRYTTVTDIRGIYAMRIPKNGRYVVHVEFAAFAAETKEALLNAGNRQQTLDYTMELASRSAQPGSGRVGRIPNATALRALGTLRALAQSGETEAAGLGNGESGVSLASGAQNANISTESVAVQGQTGTVNPFANIDQSQLQQRLEDLRAQNALTRSPGQSGGRGGRGFHGGGGRGGPGGFFRHFNPTQPHGAIFYQGENSALDAVPFSVTGTPIVQPPYNDNTAGIVFIGPPQIPHILKPSTSNFIFIGGFLTRNSTPFNQYAIVPTGAERSGDFSHYTGTGTTVVPIYNPATGLQFPGNKIPVVNPQAKALLPYIPLPNQPGVQNFEYLTTAQTNQSRIGARFVHNFGSGGGGAALAPLLQSLMGNTNHGLTQNVNANFNFSHAATDLLNVFPQLGGASQTYQYSLTAGYVIGYQRSTNNASLNFNRTNAQVSNFFTGKTDVASRAGIQGLGTDPFNYGVPSIVFSQFQGVSEQAPKFTLNQTIAFQDTASWTGKKHNVRFGGDYRRIRMDVQGGTNVTGSFYFTGFATQRPGGASVPGQQASGADFADFLLGLPQEAALQQGVGRFYYAANVFDLFLQDDWHPLNNLTVLYGLRYEYFSPYTEEHNRLTNLAFTPNLSQLAVVYPNSNSAINGRYPASVINPDRKDFAPRIGFAWRAMKQTVVRGGYGINYNTGQYAAEVQNLSYQPPFANTITNIVPAQSPPTLSLATALKSGTTPSGITNNFAFNKNYLLGYVQVWNLDVQKTLPLNIVLNVDYNGAKGTHLDLVDAPNRQLSGLLNPLYPSFNYETSIAFSNYNALVVRANKRLQNGISMGATYTYSHSIDDASSIGQSTTVVAQNQQDILAEEGNSSFDIRHQVVGQWLYELPFGPNTRFLSSGSWLGHALSNLSVSGTFDFATGVPLSPQYQAASADVARGSAGSQRPNRVPGSSLTAGGGTLRRWFNPAAFSPPVNPVTGAPEYGNASRNSIPGPGTVSVDMSLSKTIHFGGTRSLELRGTANNVFNTVQYATVNSYIDSPTQGQVTSAATMRQILFLARFRY
ncbi:MAG: TonB-dependent receptor [Acidobacteriaceae bacterium]